MAETKSIVVRGTKISIIERKKKDFISLTDMAKGFEEWSVLIEKWLLNKNTIEFIGIWEQINNPYFNSPEFEGIKNRAQLNRFTLLVKNGLRKPMQ
jgi:KilA domain-containing protein